MRKEQDLTGKKFGNLTVIKRLAEKEDRYYRWLCQCDCGRMIKVNTKKLNRGTIRNCGCIPKNNAKHGQIAENLTGRRFGKLVVLKRAENRRGRTAWECQCDCGNKHIATAKELKDGKCKSCGCLRYEKYRSMKDIRGKKVGKLTVLFPTEKRDAKGSVYWHCRCECGNEIDVSEDGLIHGNYRSCGCYKREAVWNNIHNQLHLIDGTCVEILEKRKHRSDNTSGFRRVYRLKNGKYRIEIGFKGERYYIATVSTLEEAINEHLKAEEIIHDGFVEAYHEWKKKVSREPENNSIPLLYEVEKIDGEFVVHTNMDLTLDKAE